MTACVHHWVLPTPNGLRVGDGSCKRCGAVRSFQLIEDDDWSGKSFEIGTAKGAAASVAARRAKAQAKA